MGTTPPTSTMYPRQECVYYPQNFPSHFPSHPPITGWQQPPAQFVPEQPMQQPFQNYPNGYGGASRRQWKLESKLDDHAWSTHKQLGNITRATKRLEEMMISFSVKLDMVVGAVARKNEFQRSSVHPHVPQGKYATGAIALSDVIRTGLNSAAAPINRSIVPATTNKTAVGAHMPNPRQANLKNPESRNVFNLEMADVNSESAFFEADDDTVPKDHGAPKGTTNGSLIGDTGLTEVVVPPANKTATEEGNGIPKAANTEKNNGANGNTTPGVPESTGTTKSQNHVPEVPGIQGNQKNSRHYFQKKTPSNTYAIALKKNMLSETRASATMGSTKVKQEATRTGESSGSSPDKKNGEDGWQFVGKQRHGSSKEIAPANDAVHPKKEETGKVNTQEIKNEEKLSDKHEEPAKGDESVPEDREDLEVQDEGEKKRSRKSKKKKAKELEKSKSAEEQEIEEQKKRDDYAEKQKMLSFYTRSESVCRTQKVKRIIVKGTFYDLVEEFIANRRQVDQKMKTKARAFLESRMSQSKMGESEQDKTLHSCYQVLASSMDDIIVQDALVLQHHALDKKASILQWTWLAGVFPTHAVLMEYVDALEEFSSERLHERLGKYLERQTELRSRDSLIGDDLEVGIVERILINGYIKEKEDGTELEDPREGRRQFFHRRAQFHCSQKPAQTNCIVLGKYFKTLAEFESEVLDWDAYNIWNGVLPEDLVPFEIEYCETVFGDPSRTLEFNKDGLDVEDIMQLVKNCPPPT